MKSVAALDQVVRYALGVLAVGLDEEAGAVSVTGTADQLAVADWMFPLLDRRPEDSQRNPLREHKFENLQDTLQIAYVPEQTSPQEMQEFTVGLRVIADNHYVFGVPVTNAVVFRGPDLTLEDWLLQTVNSTGPAEPYGEPGSRDQARIFRIRTADPDAVRNILVELRATAGIIRCVAFPSKHSIAVRGTEREVDLAEKIIARLDLPAPR